ncbi:hypothetical protein P7C70_g6871, partial [Phenoliferia sp. Uapishka_3]
MYKVAPGLGPGGHASFDHLPIVHDTGAPDAPTFSAHCLYCDFKTSDLKTSAMATQQWRNRHARHHGISSFDLALFHPSLPRNVIPSMVPRSEGTGLAYFAKRALGQQILEYAALMGESRHLARRARGLLYAGRRDNNSWETTVIPGDEIAQLYRRTRLTPSVAAYPPPRTGNKRTDTTAFLGMGLSGFNTNDKLLAAVGEDFDPETLGSCLWFWIFGARVRHHKLVTSGFVAEDDEAWELYRKQLYETISTFALRISQNFNKSTSELPPLDFKLFTIGALPLHPYTSPDVLACPPNDLYFAPLQSQIIALSRHSLSSPHPADILGADSWLYALSFGGSEAETWIHTGWAKTESMEGKGWPRLVCVWSALSSGEKATWSRRQDPGRLARATANELRERERIASKMGKAKVQDQVAFLKAASSSKSLRKSGRTRTAGAASRV